MNKPLETSLEKCKCEMFSDRQCLYAIACVVFLTYSVCLTTTMAHSDDYQLIWEMLSDKLALLKIVVPTGRAVTGLISNVVFLPVNSVERLWIPRLVSMCGIAVLLGLLFTKLRQFGYSQYFSLVFATLATFLPSFTVYAAWASCCTFVFAAIAGLGAFSLADRAWVAEAWSRRALRALFAVGLMVVALNIYQPLAMFYLVALLFLLLSPTSLSQEEWRRLGFHSAVVIVSLGIAFVIHHLYASTGRGSLDLNLWRKAPWFRTEPLGGSLALMFFPEETWLGPTGLRLAAKLLTGLLGVGLYLFLKGTPRSRMLRMVVAGALLPMLYLPNLLVDERWASFRTRGAIAAAVLFMACCGVSGLADRLRRGRAVALLPKAIVLATLLLLGASVAQHHVIDYFVLPFEFDWRLVRQQMARTAVSHPEPLREVVFLLPDIRYPIRQTWEYDEFGHLSLAQSWVPKPLCGLALREVAPDRLAAYRAATFTMVPSGKDSPVPADGRWIIDVRFIKGLSDALYAEMEKARENEKTVP